MSRVGKLPVAVPSGVTTEISPQAIVVKGKKGTLTLPLTSDVNVSFTDGSVLVQPANDSSRSRAMWGTTRANIQNMVKGVSDGFTIRMEIVGVGYRAAVEGNLLTLFLGYSHEIKYVIPEGISIVAEKPTTLVVTGYNRQLLGQVAAEIRRLRKPEPYKGKGIRYEGERVRMKEGKKK